MSISTRLHSTLAMIPTDEFEQNYYVQIDASSADEDTSKKKAGFIALAIGAVERPAMLAS